MKTKAKILIILIVLAFIFGCEDEQPFSEWHWDIIIKEKRAEGYYISEITMKKKVESNESGKSLEVKSDETNKPLTEIVFPETWPMSESIVHEGIEVLIKVDEPNEPEPKEANLEPMVLRVTDTEATWMTEADWNKEWNQRGYGKVE